MVVVPYYSQNREHVFSLRNYSNQTWCFNRSVLSYELQRSTVFTRSLRPILKRIKYFCRFSCFIEKFPREWKTLFGYQLSGEKKRKNWPPFCLFDNVHSLLLEYFRPHYNLDLRSISVGGQVLSIDPSVFSTSINHGAIIDSGTTLSYLADEAYNAFIDAVSTKLDSILTCHTRLSG